MQLLPPREEVRGYCCFQKPFCPLACTCRGSPGAAPRLVRHGPPADAVGQHQAAGNRTGASSLALDCARGACIDWSELATLRKGVSALSDDDVVRFLRGQGLGYPLGTKDEFIAQMTRVKRSVTFHGRRYDVGSAAHLVPDFFFPITSEADLLVKVRELLMARGLVPMAGPS